MSDESVLKIRYDGCPLCAHAENHDLGCFDCSQYPIDTGALPRQLRWLQCVQCGHVYTDSYYTGAGLQELFRHAHTNQVMDAANADQMRMLWAETVERTLRFLPESSLSNEPLWLDVGCGSGGLVAVAAEFGCRSIGLDLREATVRSLRDWGYAADQIDFLQLNNDQLFDIISFADVLEHMAFPMIVLKKAYDLLNLNGLVLVSCPNYDCFSWRAMDKLNANPYWVEMEHHHNFSRALLNKMLAVSGFKPCAYAVSRRYKAGMEIIARRID